MTEVEKPVAAGLLSPTKAQVALDAPVDMELETSTKEEEDLYTRLKTLQRQLEFYEIQVSLLGSSRTDFFRLSSHSMCFQLGISQLVYQ